MPMLKKGDRLCEYESDLFFNKTDFIRNKLIDYQIPIKFNQYNFNTRFCICFL